ncbi:MAG: UvrD-helicase domain-containing protein, partial [Mailhella sp.]|nr:UvrD-helicase domain-containing protein [Mailhella sp.]
MESLSKGGTLTIVGDVKQAIYGWRGGDATLFDSLVSPRSPLLSL